MTTARHIARQLEILKKLEGKPIGRASDMLHGVPRASGETKRRKSNARPGPDPLTDIFPRAEKLGELDGASLWRIRTTAATDGSITRQGYSCPCAEWGGAPAPEILSLLLCQPDCLDCELESIVFLDTETTGLATGAGTQAFLIGLGRFTEDGAAFTVDQYFMDDFAAEPLLVEAVDRELREAEALVTYNGRTYDMPLLASRWAMQRRAPRFPEAHLDLLHPARRLWRLALDSCSLGSVERNVLGIERMSDVPGMLIPTIYLEAQRGIHPERLVGVFDHHAQDIFSLGALAALFARALVEPNHTRFATAEIQWGLARMAESRGDRDAALQRLEAAVLAARAPDFEWRLAMHLAKSYKKAGRLDDALAVWHARVTQCRPGRLEPLIELAKHAEHFQRNIEAALEWTRRALRVLDDASINAWYSPMLADSKPKSNDARAQLEKRLARTQRRLDKQKRTAQ